MNLLSLINDPRAAALSETVFDLDGEPDDDNDSIPEALFSMSSIIHRPNNGVVGFAVEVEMWGFDDGMPLWLDVIEVRRLHAALGKWIEAHDFVESVLGAADESGDPQ